MLATVVVVALARSRASHTVLLVATAVVVCAVLAGALFRKHVRRSGNLQLASAAAMSVVAVPIELAGGVSAPSIALNVAAWAVVFVSSGLCVRAIVARASRVRRGHASWLAGGALAVPLVATVLFVSVGAHAQAVASLIAALGFIVLGATRPSVKQMKRVGLSLASVAALAGVALGFF